MPVINGKIPSPAWWSVHFETPRYPQTKGGSEAVLFLKLTHGRGHLWLNGRDLGRYWNITRGHEDTWEHDKDMKHQDFDYTQQFYPLPMDYMVDDAAARHNGSTHDSSSVNETTTRLNHLLLVDVHGGSNLSESVELVLSWMEPTGDPTLKDVVSYPMTCLE